MHAETERIKIPQTPSHNALRSVHYKLITRAALSYLKYGKLKYMYVYDSKRPYSYLSKFPWKALAPASLMFVSGLVSALAPITVLWL